MEENEESSSDVNKSMVFEMEDKLFDTEELKITEECNFVTDPVPKLGDFVGFNDDSNPVQEDKSLIAVTEIQNSVTDVKDSGVVGDEARSLEEEGSDKAEAVAVERETGSVVVGGKIVRELSELQSVSEVKDSGDVVEEAREMELKPDSKAVEEEVEIEPVMGNDGGRETVGELSGEEFVGREIENEDKEMAGRENAELSGDLHNVAADVELMEEKLAMEIESQTKADGTQSIPEFDDEKEDMETEKGTEEVKVETLSVHQLHDLQLAEELGGRVNSELSADLHNAAEDGAVEEESIIVKEENLAVEEESLAVEEDLAMETETKRKVDGIESVPEIDDEEEDMETEKDAEVVNVEGRESFPRLDDLQLPEDDVDEDEDEDDETMVGEDEITAVDTEMEKETYAVELVKDTGGKRKRGRNSKVPAKAPARKITTPVEGEDVCFICFDGGDLVLCDRK